MGVEFLLIMAVFLGLMFFMSNRAKKQQASQRENLLNQLEPGVGVLTIGGFYGRVVDVDGDVVTLESPSGVETIWSKTAIREVKEPPFAEVEEDLDAPDVEVPDDASGLTTADNEPRDGDSTTRTDDEGPEERRA